MAAVAAEVAMAAASAAGTVEDLAEATPEVSAEATLEVSAEAALADSPARPAVGCTWVLASAALAAVILPGPTWAASSADSMAVTGMADMGTAMAMTPAIGAARHTTGSPASNGRTPVTDAPVLTQAAGPRRRGTRRHMTHLA